MINDLSLRQKYEKGLKTFTALGSSTPRSQLNCVVLSDGVYLTAIVEKILKQGQIISIQVGYLFHATWLFVDFDEQLLLCSAKAMTPCRHGIQWTVPTQFLYVYQSHILVIISWESTPYSQNSAT